MNLQQQARELELYATGTERFYPHIQTIEKVAMYRIHNAGEGQARDYACDELINFLAIPARQYLQEHYTEPGFQFDYVAITLAAGKMAADMIEDLLSEYKEWIAEVVR